MSARRSIRDVERSVPSDKPPIQDVAAMPYPLSMLTMRKHYNPLWGRPCADGEMVKWIVDLRYSYQTWDNFRCEVDAVTEEEAIEVAKVRFDRECSDRFEADLEIDYEEAKAA